MPFVSRLIARSLPILPRRLVRWVAGPYIAGETPEDALRVVGALNGRGALATLDLLGEEVRDPARSAQIADGYVAALGEISRRGLRSGVSVKLSGLGIRFDPALARDLLRRVLVAAREAARFVRIDMEDSSLTDETLAVYREARAAGFHNVGVVLQACLRRTMRDAEAVAALGGSVRLVKGIYVEPEAIAFRDREEVRTAYVEVLRYLVSRGLSVAAATHDGALVAAAKTLMAERGMAPGSLEFQMLLGVREALRDSLLRDGHRVRIYVPYGEHWYEYSLRRLRENPAIAGHVTKQMFGRIFRFRGRKP